MELVQGRSDVMVLRRQEDEPSGGVSSLTSAVSDKPEILEARKKRKG